MKSKAAILLWVHKKYGMGWGCQELSGAIAEECIARSGGETSSDLANPETTAERKAFESSMEARERDWPGAMARLEQMKASATAKPAPPPSTFPARQSLSPAPEVASALAAPALAPRGQA